MIQDQGGASSSRVGRENGAVEWGVGDSLVELARWRWRWCCWLVVYGGWRGPWLNEGRVERCKDDK